MTTPAQGQASGQRRYYTAAQVSAAVTAVFAAAQIAMLAALASLTAQVLAGSLLAAVAARMLRSSLLIIVSDAETKLRVILASATASARADVQAIIEADLGPMARLIPVIPSASMPKLGPALRQALLNAGLDAETAFREALAAGDPQEVLDEVALRGLTAITDSGGRDWEMTWYAAMAARTATERLHLALQARAFAEAGIDLVRVVRDSATPPCPKCLPWQRRILSLSGRTPQFPTLAYAMSAGLLHFACRDSVIPFNGRMPPEPSPEWIARQARRYEAERAARARWSAYRKAQRLRAVAMTPRALARSRALRRALSQS